jgi:LmeA-like phospholipid-binding
MNVKSRGIISSVLSPACAAWLRTQVSAVESLDIQISAGDRQILTGTIPHVSILATATVYRGISLQKINLLAEQIEVNLGQMMRGKPFRLLQPLLVEATATIGEADLLSSLTAPMLARAVNDLVGQAIGLPTGDLPADWTIEWQQAQMQTGQLTIRGFIQQGGQTIPLTVAAAVTLLAGHIIKLAPLTVDCPLIAERHCPDYAIDLGHEVNLSQMEIGIGELLCAGQIKIRP